MLLSMRLRPLFQCCLFGWQGLSVRSFASRKKVSLMTDNVSKPSKASVRGTSMRETKLRVSGKPLTSDSKQHAKQYSAAQVALYKKFTAMKSAKARERVQYLKRIATHGFKKTPKRFLLATLNYLKAGNPKNKSQKQISITESSERRSFLDLKIPDSLIAALKVMNILDPNVIQSVSIPHIIKEKKVILAAQTGSGKTLSYMLPLYLLLMSSSRADSGDGAFVGSPRASPKAVIFLPTRELCFQTLKIAKHLGRYAKLKVEALIPGADVSHRNSCFNESYDILITIPSVFLSSVKSRKLKIDKVECLIMDEGDSLFDSEFRDELKTFLSESKIEALKKVIILSATITRPVIQFLEERFPNIVKIISNLIHVPPSTVSQRFLQIGPGYRARDKLLLQLLQSNVSSKIMVFCNDRHSAEALHGFVKKEIPDALCIHGNIQPLSRKRIMKEFYEKDKGVLICTDLASRGIDVMTVNHVILYEFPKNSVDYLHRIGRTGRMGQKGKVTCLISKKDKHLVKLVDRVVKSKRSFSEMLSFAE